MKIFLKGQPTLCKFVSLFCSRCNNRLRRPSSDEISTPTSLRSRSSSLLSSDYIPEENEPHVGDENGRGQPSSQSPVLLPLLPPPTFKAGSRRTSSSSHSSCSKNSHEMANDIDRLVKLVHELKEEDLNNYKRKIAEAKKSEERESSRHRDGSSEERSVSNSPKGT